MSHERCSICGTWGQKTRECCGNEFKDVDKLAADQLLHFRFGPIWDGNLNSKSARDRLVDLGFLERQSGFQFLTAKGLKHLVDTGKLNESTWRLGWKNKDG